MEKWENSLFGDWSQALRFFFSFSFFSFPIDEHGDLGDSEISVPEGRQKSDVLLEKVAKCSWKVGFKMTPWFSLWFSWDSPIHLPVRAVNYFSIYLVDLQAESNLLPENCLTPMLSGRHSDPVRLTAAGAQLLSHCHVKLAPAGPRYKEEFSRHCKRRIVLRSQ